MSDVKLNREQNEAFEFAMEGKEDLFITGGAGTGKSFLIDIIKKAKLAKENSVAVCAFTGIAARNVKGVTVHRLFNLGIGPIIHKAPEPPSVLEKVDTIIIDEISMLRCDVFEHVMDAVINARVKFKKDIQIIVVGDFHQLPPVLPYERGERDVLSEHYKSDSIGKLYAFQSSLWKFRCIELKEIIRQKDKDFSRALNMVRVGDSFGLSWLDMHKSAFPPENAPFGVSTNEEAKIKNAEGMDALDESTERCYPMIIKGNVNENDYKPQERELIVRNGARVMILVNDTSSVVPDYVNGSMGIVLETTEKSVKVKLLDNDKIIDFYKMKNSVFEYKINTDGKLEQTEVGAFWQIPLKPCYALTVHKMQGITLEALNLTPANWEDGLLYTALSRVTNVNKLYYEGNLSDLTISCNQDVAEFYSDPENYVYDWNTKDE